MRTLSIFLCVASLFGPWAHARTIELDVKGLVCGFCAQGIRATLEKHPATAEVYVSLEHGLVAVATHPDQDIDDPTLEKALTDAGYTVERIQRTDETLEQVRARREGGQ